jgi:hypothetical protein
MEKPKKVSRPTKLPTPEEAALRASLPQLLRRADSSAEAAQEALRACIKLRRRAPANLLKKENISNALSLSEASRSLHYLSVSQEYLDMSAALAALRVLANRQLSGTFDRKALLKATRELTSGLTKIARHASKTKKVPESEGRSKSDVILTDSTMSTAADLALLVLTRLFEQQSKSLRSVYPIAFRSLQSVELIWRRSFSPSATRSAVKFLSSLERMLPPNVYAELEAEPAMANLIRDSDSRLVQDATAALLDGRLKDLEGILSLVTRDEKRRKQLLSELQEACQKRPSELIPEVVEWVARQIETGFSRTRPPTAADESQSAALDYVVVSLLAAWDAATGSNGSSRVLESVRRLARELFKVDLTGTPGEIVSYDERQHEVKSNLLLVSNRVQLVRPGVRWSDGIRTRFLVRAIVEPAS